MVAVGVVEAVQHALVVTEKAVLQVFQSGQMSQAVLAAAVAVAVAEAAVAMDVNAL